jgi:hypothetical protein
MSEEKPEDQNLKTNIQHENQEIDSQVSKKQSRADQDSKKQDHD